MKSINKTSVIIIFILSLPLIWPGYMLYSEYLMPYVIAHNYDTKLIDNHKVENLTIYEGDDKYLIFIRNKKEPFVVNASDGVNREQAIKIAKENNIKSDEVFVSVKSSTYSSDEDAKDSIIWIIKDNSSGENIIIDFLTGNFKKIKMK